MPGQVIGERRAHAEYGEEPVPRGGVSAELRLNVRRLQDPEQAGEGEVGVGRGAERVEQCVVEVVTLETALGTGGVGDAEPGQPPGEALESAFGHQQKVSGATRRS
jgi:hypothetical protein